MKHGVVYVNNKFETWPGNKGFVYDEGIKTLCLKEKKSYLIEKHLLAKLFMKEIRFRVRKILQLEISGLNMIIVQDAACATVVFFLVKGNSLGTEST